MKSAKNNEQLVFWDRLFYFLLILTGIAWSCVSIWLLPDSNSIEHYLPSLILIGISAGGIGAVVTSGSSFV